MPWAKIDDGFTDHPKVIAAGPMASWLYVCGLTYSARLLTDGFIPAGQVRKLADVDGATALADTLVSVGLWERAEGGFQIHDYLEYNPSAEKVKAERKAAQERMQKLRSGEVRANKERSSGAGSGELQAPRPVPSRPTPVTVQKENDLPAGDTRAQRPDVHLLVLDEPTAQPALAPATKPAPKPASKKTKLPADWDQQQKWGPLYDWAKQEVGMSEQAVDYETDKFMDHWQGNGELKENWLAAWRNWMRRSQEGFSRARR